MSEIMGLKVGSQSSGNENWEYIGIFSNGQSVSNIGNYKKIAIGTKQSGFDIITNISIVPDVELFVTNGILEAQSFINSSLYSFVNLSTGAVTANGGSAYIFGSK